MARRPALANIESASIDRTLNALASDDDRIEARRQERAWEDEQDQDDRIGEAAFERALRERA